MVNNIVKDSVPFYGLVYVGEADIQSQTAFFDNEDLGLIRQSRAKTFCTNAFNVSLGNTLTSPLLSIFEDSPEPAPSPLPEPSPEPAPVPEPAPET